MITPNIIFWELLLLLLLPMTLIMPSVSFFRRSSAVLLSIVFLFLHSTFAAASSNDAWKLPPGTTAVVTGGTKGIGRAIVQQLLQQHHGCRVLTCSRNETELHELLSHYSSKQLQGVVADVATRQGREILVNAIFDFCGSTQKLDILINNVGTNIRKPSTEYTDEDIQHIWNTNFHSMFALTTACHALLKRDSATETTTSSSSVVNIGSVAGVTCIKSGTPYGATKAAMNQLTGNLACEWGLDGIRVNCVTPWYINTPLAKQVLKNEAYKQCV